MEQKNDAVCKLSEIEDGGMKEVEIGSTPVLLVRKGDECFAVGARCTHYGGPLIEGALVGDRLICPWHHACFHAATGDLIDPPALDSLPSFPVRIIDDGIFVDLPDNAPDRRPPLMTAPNDKPGRTTVIIGGGAAGYTAAQTLREAGFDGRITMITREDRTPYDRPNLSKDYLQGSAQPEWMPLRPDEFYSENGIEVLTNKEVSRVVNGSKTIEFSDGETLGFDDLLIATGGIARTIDIPGSDFRGVMTLRSFASADDIIAAAGGAQKAAVIGASFIAMETAASLKTRGIDVTVIAPDKVPFERVLGAEIGAVLKDVHQKNGVKFELGENVAGFEGDGYVTGVRLDSGSGVDCDLVVLGVGVRPATEMLEGFEMHKDGGVIADANLRIGENIYAAGDIVHFPDQGHVGHIRIEHWRTAMQQGRAAAYNIAGKQAHFDGVPFFWTTQFDATLNYVGSVREWDEIIVDGEIASKIFVAYYIKDGKAAAAAGMERDRELAYFQEALRANNAPTAEELRKRSGNGY